MLAVIPSPGRDWDQLREESLFLFCLVQWDTEGFLAPLGMTGYIYSETIQSFLLFVASKLAYRPELLSEVSKAMKF